MTTPTSSAFPGTLHRYTPHLVAFALFPATPAEDSPPHTLLFIGGLCDTLVTPAYTSSLHASLPSSWTLVSPLLSSSGTGFGTSTLDKDISELAACVQYFRALHPGGKLVLLGHSTGAQDVLHYLSSPGYSSQRAPVDGAILQGSVSDREALATTLAPSDLERLNAVAAEMTREGRADDVLPAALSAKAFPSVALTARRWLSLASPAPAHEGLDDMFSSDLPDSRLRETFGRVGATGVPICVLYGGRDEYVPEEVDKEGLVRRWVGIVREGGGTVDEGSGVVEGVTHTMVEVGQGSEEFLRRVGFFLGRVEGGVEEI